MKKLTKEEGASPDVVAENVEALRELFPEVFAEGHIDFDALKETLGEYVDEREERYSFTWHGKSRARQIAQMPSTGTLLPCPDESVNWDTTKNVFIEGDNLEVLKLLQKSYHRKVKMIYIDPPYNTGKEFIYPDKWQDNLDTYLRYTGQVDDEGLKLSANSETSGRYHTNWLNMMYPRLKLARNLLAANGAIFVTIDDHENHNLRQVMDEIFGPENFVSSIAWQKVFAKKNKALISGSHDHILVYTRDIDSWYRNLLPRNEKQLSAFKNPDNDPRGKWQSVSFSVQSEDSEKRAAYRYEVELPSGRVTGPPTGRHWNGLVERFEELREDGRIWFGSDGDSAPREKIFLSEVQGGIVPDTWWKHEDVGNNQDAKREILELFKDSEPFSTPKPTRLVRRMLQIATQSDTEDIILDFFAGSGTTGHAVMAQNKEDSGNRRFLLVQLPEKTGQEDFETISDVAIARLCAACAKLDGGAGQAEGETRNSSVGMAGGVRVFKLSSSNIKLWDSDFESMEQDLVDSIDNIKSDRSEADVLYELLLKYGLDVAIPIESREMAGRRVNVIGAGALVVCLANDITLDVVSGGELFRLKCAPYSNQDGQLRGATMMFVESNLPAGLHSGRDKAAFGDSLLYVHRRADGTILSVGANSARLLFGTTPDKLEGRTMREHVSQASFERSLAEDKAFLQSGKDNATTTYGVRFNAIGEDRLLLTHRFRLHGGSRRGRHGLCRGDPAGERHPDRHPDRRGGGLRPALAAPMPSAACWGMRSLHKIAVALAVLTLAAAPASAETRVSLELVLLADATGSIDDDEIRFQRQGYATAITDPAVVQAIEDSGFGRIAVTYVEWADALSQDVVVGWTLIEDRESAEDFARRLMIPPRRAYGRNAIGSALLAGKQLIETNDYDGLSRVIDFSADSANNWNGPSIPEARAEVLAAGITINGLAVLCRTCWSGRPIDYDLEAAFRDLIVGGAGAFVITADSPQTFADAVRRKLILEIAGSGPGKAALLE